MKWYHWVLLAVAALLLMRRYRRSRGIGTYTGPAPYDPMEPIQDVQAKAAIEANVGLAYAGADIAHMRPAYTGSGWNPYPGWYRTGDGGWYNPDSHQWYLPGSSPPVLPEPANIKNPLVIDLSVGGGTPSGNGQAYFIA